MLRVRLLCMGRIKEPYFRDACAEYAKRLRAYCSFSVEELLEERLPDAPAPAQVRSALAAEGRRLLARAGGDALVALCIEGEPTSSEALAQTLGRLALYGESSVSFAVGSSYGLSDEVKRAARLRLSMSPMTFPHTLARVMLCEQLYRAFQLQQGGKYHK